MSRRRPLFAFNQLFRRLSFVVADPDFELRETTNLALCSLVRWIFEVNLHVLIIVRIYVFRESMCNLKEEKAFELSFEW